MTKPECIRENVLLAAHTTLGLGGYARYFARAADIPELTSCLRWASAAGLPVHVLGGGSNTVFADTGFPGLILHIALPGRTFTQRGGHVLVTAAAGEVWADLVDACVERGLGGIECLAGIPGQVGAAPIQNVGAYGQELAEVLWQVRALDRVADSQIQLQAGECGLGYRRSRFKTVDEGRFIILSVTVRLRAGALPRIRYPELARMVRARGGLEKLEQGAPGLRIARDAVIALRRRKSMMMDAADPESRSVGSFFVNPVLTREQFQALRARLPRDAELTVHRTSEGVKVSAAWLIEAAGFTRGYARDGVAVSARHALALVNHQGSSRALLALAGDIQRAVQERFGVWLLVEPVVVSGSGKSPGPPAVPCTP